MISFKEYLIFLLCMVQLPAFAIDEETLYLPHLNKGIWAIKHEQHIKGKEPQLIPERFTTWCFDPDTKIREDILAIQKNQCAIYRDPKSSSNELIYSIKCANNSRTSQQINLSIKSENPDKFEVVNTSEESKNILEGRWVRKCP